MGDDIDKTQWLPRDTPILNPFRIKRGDLDWKTEGQGKHKRITAAWGPECSVWNPDHTLMGWLLDHGFLERHHTTYALTLLDLRLAYDANQGITWTRVDTGIASLSPGQAAEFYHAVCIALGRRAVGLIEWSAITPAADAKNAWNAISGEVIAKDYNRLVEAMDEQWASMKKNT